MRLLLAKGARANRPTRNSLVSPLFRACTSYADRDGEVVAALLRAGADVRQPTSRGLTPLERARACRAAGIVLQPCASSLRLSPSTTTLKT